MGKMLPVINVWMLGMIGQIEILKKEEKETKNIVKKRKMKSKKKRKCIIKLKYGVECVNVM